MIDQNKLFQCTSKEVESLCAEKWEVKEYGITSYKCDRYFAESKFGEQNVLKWKTHFRIDTVASNQQNTNSLTCNSFLKIGQPKPLFAYFRSFQTNNTILTTNQCEKCDFNLVYGAGIWTHDLSNMRHLPKPLYQGSRPNTCKS